MSLTREEVRRVAALARLRPSPEEAAALAAQLARVIADIDQHSADERTLGRREEARVPRSPRAA